MMYNVHCTFVVSLLLVSGLPSGQLSTDRGPIWDREKPEDVTSPGSQSVSRDTCLRLATAQR